jgi:hypothetical protein
VQTARLVLYGGKVTAEEQAMHDVVVLLINGAWNIPYVKPFALLFLVLMLLTLAWNWSGNEDT